MMVSLVFPVQSPVQLPIEPPVLVPVQLPVQLPILLPVLLTAVCCAGLAAALAPRGRRLVETRSAWLHPAVPATLAALLGAGAASTGTGPMVVLALAALAVSAGLLVPIDLAVHRLPDAIVGPVYPVLTVLLALAAAVQGEWGRLGRALLAGLALLALYLALALISPTGIGLGDVKYSGALGMALGWFGWGAVATGTLAAFVLNGAVALLVVLARRGDRGGEVPFGPAMVAGTVIGIAVAVT